MKKLFIFLIKAYRKTLSKELNTNCRFTPTCSQYALDALKEYNLAYALFLICWRLLRCNPFNKNCGYDPVPLNKRKIKWVL